MESLLTTDALISLLTLTLLEVILGIDNIIFITIVAAKLPKQQQAKAQNYGLGIALVLRVALLLYLLGYRTKSRPVFGL